MTSQIYGLSASNLDSVPYVDDLGRAVGLTVIDRNFGCG